MRGRSEPAEDRKLACGPGPLLPSADDHRLHPGRPRAPDAQPLPPLQVPSGSTVTGDPWSPCWGSVRGGASGAVRLQARTFSYAGSVTIEIPAAARTVGAADRVVALTMRSPSPWSLTRHLWPVGHDISNATRDLASASVNAIVRSCNHSTEPSPGVRTPHPGRQGADHRTARPVGKAIRPPDPAPKQTSEDQSAHLAARCNSPAGARDLTTSPIPPRAPGLA